MRAVALFLLGGLALLPFQEFAVRFAMPAFDPSQHLKLLPASDGKPQRGPAGETQRQIINTGDYDVTVSFNQHGLRDKKDVAEGQLSDYYMVGDSFAFGSGVEEKERLSERLEALIGVSVFNLSIPGNLMTYTKMLTYANDLGASISKVILVITMENDIDHYGVTHEVTSSAPLTDKSSLWFPKIKHFLTRNSALYFLATRLVHNVSWIKQAAIWLGLVRPNLASVHGRNDPLDAIVSTVRRIADIADQYDTTVVLIASRGLWVEKTKKRAERTHDALIARLRERGIEPVDLRSVFERSGRPLDFHFANDGHWRPIGHAKAAEAIYERLRSVTK